MGREIATKYNPSDFEEKRYQEWLNAGYFHSEPDEREAYTVVIPPPNVTGVLHMGHMLNNTIQDVLVRRARMLGKNVCWVPGTDHASIATEAKVVAKLKDEGVSKFDIGREAFLKHAWDWTDKHGGIILEQLKKLGASCDWDRTAFTMDEDRSEQVIDTFIDLYNKGQIYRGVRMVNWDPSAKTAVSDEEVIRKEVQAALYYVSYQVEGSDESITIATTRPETILGDTAICIHPEDERYTHLHGKNIIVPFAERSVPIILDDYVDREFGTGCLKVTPAHDINDYELGIKHNLETIDVLNEDGTLNEYGKDYQGQTREEARKNVVRDLKEMGRMVKVENLSHNVGFSERTDAVIEPRLSMQWFLKMDELSKPALDNVMDDTIQFHPAKFKNSYRHWMENVRDWCISRQLWWGHQIPVFYYGNGVNDFVVAENAEKALPLAKEKSGKGDLSSSDLRQDEDVLDTWFSSWLWPISVFNGIKEPDNKDIAYYYPSNDLVTAPEIMFFWVARMIIAGYEYLGDKPFKNVYYTGIVRDKQGRKMSKSLGNSPDPIKMMQEQGADGVRVGMLLSSPAGNDLPFDISLVEQGRSFANKVWNAFRLINMWEVDASASMSEAQKLANDWFDSRFNASLEEINKRYDEFRISDALMSSYKLIWDDFCSWYLELIKPNYGEAISKEAKDLADYNMERILKVLHPFMPFISEELWQNMEERSKEEALMISSWPELGKINTTLLEQFEITMEVISNIRKIRKERNISFKNALDLTVKGSENEDARLDASIAQLCNLSAISYGDQAVENAFSFVVKGKEYFIPFGESIDVEAELKKIEEELKYTKGFLTGVMKKLGNEKFVQNAPEKAVEMERKKQADAESKIALLEEKLEALNK